MNALALALALALPAHAGTVDLTLRAEGFDASSELSYRVRVVLERMQATYVDVLGLPDQEVPVHVRLIADRGAYDALYAEVSSTWTNRPESTLGFFHPVTGGVMWRNTSDAALLGTLVHEASHHLLAEGGGSVPRWTNEGLAEVFERFRVAGNAVWLDPAPDHLAAIRRGGLPPVRELLQSGDGGWAALEGRTPNAVYAYGWALSAHLLSSRAGRATLRAIADARAPRDPDAITRVVDATYPGGTSGLDRALRAWIAAGPRPLQLGVSRGPAEVTPDEDPEDPCPGGVMLRRGTETVCVR